jgi:hypothetical protein
MSISESVFIEPGTSGFDAPVTADKVVRLVGEYRVKRAQIERVGRMIETEAGEVLGHFLEGNCRERHYSLPTSVGRLFQIEGAIASLNADYWSRALRLTDVLDAMPQSRRSEWFEQISELKTPDFEEETVRSTLISLLNSREVFFAERVDGVFRALSQSHVTNQPQGFSKRMILDGVVDQWGTSSHVKAGYINDLRAVVARLTGREEPHWHCTPRALSIAAQRWGSWHVLDGGALRIKVFRKGTAHIEVHPDMAWRLNAVLATLYPAAIPASKRTQPLRPPKAFALMSTPLPFRVIGAVSAALGRHQEGTEFRLSSSELGSDHILQREVTSLLSMIGGAQTNALTYEFQYDPREVLEEIVMTGLVPEHRSHQFYPTPDTLAQEAVELAEIEDGHRCLEPSAGQGGIAAFMPRDQTTCIEISPLFSKVLTSKGFHVETMDFMTFATTTPNRYDRIVMNPPFADGRATQHVQAAAGLLKPGGRLVAVLPASLRHKTMLEGFDHTWGEVRSNEFEGTGVRVALLVASKKG